MTVESMIYTHSKHLNKGIDIADIAAASRLTTLH
jgi:hypothetical protein